MNPASTFKEGWKIQTVFYENFEESIEEICPPSEHLNVHQKIFQMFDLLGTLPCGSDYFSFNENHYKVVSRVFSFEIKLIEFGIEKI